MADTMINTVASVDASNAHNNNVAGMASATPSTSAASQAARPAKRAVGGFVDSDDEDDEDDNEASKLAITETLAGPVQPAEPIPENVPEVDLTALPPQSLAQTEASTAPLDTSDIPIREADSILQDAQIDDGPPEENEEDRYDLLFSAGSQPATLDAMDTYDSFDTFASITRPRSPPPLATTITIQTCKGRAIPVRQRTQRHSAPVVVPYQDLVAQRSKTKEGRAQRSYFGIAIHELVDGAQKEIAQAKKEEAARLEKERKEEEAKEAAKEAAAMQELLDADNAEAEQAMLADFEDDMEKDNQKDKGKGKAATTVLPPTKAAARRPKKTLLWTEKYRARNFMDLVGDDLTNRNVLRWLKRWDPVVFPGTKRAAPIKPARPAVPAGAPPTLNGNNGYKGAETAEEKPHRKILILTGPPGLGKTTLAHVCARQAGYEVLEINASDDRSRDVVNGRIRTSLGTESVKVNTVASLDKTKNQKSQKTGRPVCVIVDEVDGVVGGNQSGGAGGEGGFVKALIDLVHLDQKNSGHSVSTAAQPARKRKGDDFRQMRPLILICNDVYHAALRPLRLSGLAEIVHVGKPSVEHVVVRLKTIFEKEGIPCEKEAARKLCEAAWGMSTAGPTSRNKNQESGAEGDLRGVMVVGEWVARRLRATAPKTASDKTPQLTRFWVEKHVLPDLSYGSGTSGNGGGGGLGARGMGRGGVREIVARIFQEGAGFPKSMSSAPASLSVSSADSASRSYRHEQPKEQMSFAEHQQRASMARLREMIETSGDVDRIMTDIFSEYPAREFNDDCYLSKPDAAYEWMHFHDACSRRVFGSQEWELAPYTSQPVLACHQLFASPKKHIPDDDAAAPGPFSGPRADFSAREAEKMNRLSLQTIQAHLPPSLLRAFRNAEDLASDFLPYIVRLVSPDVKPVLVNVANPDKNAKGPTSVASVRRDSEKVLVRRAAEVLAELGIKMQRGILEEAATAAPGRPQWVYRMEPDLDMLSSFETASGLIMTGNSAPTRYAVRQVLDQELRKTLAARDNAARQARFQAGTPLGASFASLDKLAEKEKDARGTKRKAAEEVAVKRDFFGRVIAEVVIHALKEVDGNARREGDASGDKQDKQAPAKEEEPVWVTYHEGLNNAVRKPISVDEFLRGL